MCSRHHLIHVSIGLYQVIHSSQGLVWMCGRLTGACASDESTPGQQSAVAMPVVAEQLVLCYYYWLSWSEKETWNVLGASQAAGTELSMGGELTLPSQ